MTPEPSWPTGPQPCDRPSGLAARASRPVAASIASTAGAAAGPARPGLSFEFFPPASDKGEAALDRCVAELVTLAPDFLSVTYGAGGSTRDRSLAVAARLVRATNLPVCAHLTCVGASRAEVDGVVDAYLDAGVRRFLALRGDAVDDDGVFRAHPQGYASAIELVSALARRGDLDISVACYPEVHPQAASARADLDNLKRKVDAGASRAISQFFFDPDVFLRFRDRAAQAGIAVPIVPGILPVQSLDSVTRFARQCGASVPRWLTDLFAPLERSPDVRALVAASVGAELCTRLRENGVAQFHFYTLNRAPLTASMCHMLGRRLQAGRHAAQAVSP